MHLWTMVTHEEITHAALRIRAHIAETPLVRADAMQKSHATPCFLKLENRQFTGSFKARGALNKLLRLQEQGI